MELTRDKFVFGLLDDTLKERLLREADLTLPKAIALAQRSESSKIQAKAMSVQNTSFQCDEVKWRPTPQKEDLLASMMIMCRQCGKRHRPKECPAFGQRCAACYKFNHFARVCRNKQIAVKPKVPNSSAKKTVFTVDGGK